MDKYLSTRKYVQLQSPMCKRPKFLRLDQQNVCWSSKSAEMCGMMATWAINLPCAEIAHALSTMSFSMKFVWNFKCPWITIMTSF